MGTANRSPRSRLLACLACSALVSTICAADHSGWTGNADLFAGTKYLLSSKIADAELELQNAVGLRWDFGHYTWPVHYVFDYTASESQSDANDFDHILFLSQFDLGVRRYFWSNDLTTNGMRPFMGGGVALLQVEEESKGYGTTHQNGVGLWLEGGVRWNLSPSWNIGVEGRYTNVHVSAADGKNSIELGSLSIGGVVGLHW